MEHYMTATPELINHHLVFVSYLKLGHQTCLLTCVTFVCKCHPPRYSVPGGQVNEPPPANDPKYSGILIVEHVERCTYTL